MSGSGGVPALLAPALLAALLTACATWLSAPFGRSRTKPLYIDNAQPGGLAGEPSRPAPRARGRGLRVRRVGVPGEPGAPGPLSEVSTRDVATALVLLALGYRSGLPTTAVLTLVADQVCEPAARDLRQVAAALQWGASEAEAWASVDVAWSPAARTIRVAHEAGIPPGALLLRASDDLQQAEVERLEVAAAQAGVRLVIPLGLVLLPAFCLTTVVPLVVALGRELMASQ